MSGSDSEYEYATGSINTFTNKSDKFIKYKQKTLGKPKRFDPHCEYYYLENEKVKDFCENIKKYGANLKIEEQHVKYLYEQIITDKDPYLVNNIALVEYNQYEVDNFEDLIEVIDGHHRIEAIIKVYEVRPDFKLGIWICLHYSNNPESPQTRKLFRKYNSLKPFLVDINISEFSSDIIQAINKKFSNNDFEAIKDATKVHRPSINKKNINEAIQKQLEILKREGKISIDLNIEKIVNKLESYNIEFSSKDINYFNDRSNEFYNDSVSLQMLERSNKNKFYLGLVYIDKLVSKCFTM
jgi:hypothetical protein